MATTFAAIFHQSISSSTKQMGIQFEKIINIANPSGTKLIITHQPQIVAPIDVKMRSSSGSNIRHKKSLAMKPFINYVDTNFEEL